MAQVVKVVREARNRFRSAIMNPNDNSGWVLEYVLGRVTTPARGYIFAFKSTDAAEEWLRHETSDRYLYHMLRCEAEIVDDSPLMSQHFHPDDMSKFWNKVEDDPQEATWEYSAAPWGTVWCKNVKPIEVMHYGDRL